MSKFDQIRNLCSVGSRCATSLLILVGLGLAACSADVVATDDVMATDQVAGKRLFEAYCAQCHGADARGKASDPALPGPALTGLARRHGGTFPAAQVMSQIDGLHRNQGSAMPEFGEDFRDPLILTDLGDGRPSPVPATLLAISNYLSTLQR